MDMSLWCWLGLFFYARASHADNFSTARSGAGISPAPLRAACAQIVLDRYFSFIYINGVTPIAVLASPRRRELLRLCWDGPRSAGDLAAALPDVTFGAVSHQLKILGDAGLVTCTREGRRRLYRAQRAAVGPLRRWLESHWDDALYALKLHAELEEARRGPPPRRK
jgi:DNA-binding transcriptional ArsR family regulator